MCMRGSENNLRSDRLRASAARAPMSFRKAGEIVVTKKTGMEKDESTEKGGPKRDPSGKENVPLNPWLTKEERKHLQTAWKTQREEKQEKQEKKEVRKPSREPIRDKQENPQPKKGPMAVVIPKKKKVAPDS